MFQSSFIIEVLPIIFMIHDFEKIIMVPHEKKIILSKASFFGNTNHTAAFSIAILVEFLLLSGTSFFSQLTGDISIYFSLSTLSLCSFFNDN